MTNSELSEEYDEADCMAGICRFLRLLKLSTLLLIVLCAQLQGCSRSPNRPVWPPATVKWPLDHAATQTITLRIPPGYNIGSAADAMAHLVYPKGIPEKAPLQPAQELLLETLWPGMGPHTYGNDKAFVVPGGGRILRILIASGAVDPAVHRQDRLHMYLHVDLMFSRNVCYPRYPGNAVCHRLKRLPQKASRFGLKHRGVDFSRFPDVPEDYYELFDDIYYSKNMKTGLKTYIKCMPDEAKTSFGIVWSPQCTQYFIYKPWNALVSIGYRRVYLKNWRVIQSKMETLLASFVVTKPAR